jgi:hypothetical protein
MNNETKRERERERLTIPPSSQPLSVVAAPECKQLEAEVGVEDNLPADSLAHTPVVVVQNKHPLSCIPQEDNLHTYIHTYIHTSYIILYIYICIYIRNPETRTPTAITLMLQNIVTDFLHRKTLNIP